MRPRHPGFFQPEVFRVLLRRERIDVFRPVTFDCAFEPLALFVRAAGFLGWIFFPPIPIPLLLPSPAPGNWPNPTKPSETQISRPRHSNRRLADTSATSMRLLPSDGDVRRNQAPAERAAD